MNESRSYCYETEIEWSTERAGIIHGPHLPAIVFGAPPEFKGREGQWAPEHLFVASLNTCYMLTFLAIADLSNIRVVSFSSTAKGKLEKVEGSGYQITEIMVKPRIVIASANDLARMPRILQKAKENCFVSNSIKSTVKLEPEIFHEQMAATPCPLGPAPESPS